MRRWRRLRLSGAFREPATRLDKPDTPGLQPSFPAAWDTICLRTEPPTRGSAYSSLASAWGCVVTSFDLAVALSVARHLCISARLPSGPRPACKQSCHRRYASRAALKPRPSREACLHDRCLDTKNLDSRQDKASLVACPLARRGASIHCDAIVFGRRNGIRLPVFIFQCFDQLSRSYATLQSTNYTAGRTFVLNETGLFILGNLLIRRNVALLCHTVDLFCHAWIYIYNRSTCK